MKLFIIFVSVAFAHGALPQWAIKRQGSAPPTSSCGNVRAIPEEIQKLKNLDMNWYAKYTEAYGIPILGSAKVSDQALVRACYTIRFLFAGRQEYRDNIYQAATHITIMAKTEVMTDVPEQKDWDKSVNKRYRGMSAMLGSTFPTTGAEENLICDCKDSDKNWLEDYFLHEAAHTLHLIGVNPTVPDFEQRVMDAQVQAKASGVWGHVYGTRDGVRNVHHEYFAEAVQSYFGANLYMDKPDGWHGPINSASEIKKLDPTVYNLIKEAIPCGDQSNYVDRCTDVISGFVTGSTQKLQMDQSCTLETTDLVAATFAADNACKGGVNQEYCGTLMGLGYCSDSKKIATGTMRKCCGCACKCTGCEAKNQCEFTDAKEGCSNWAKWGECEANPGWMAGRCGKSCSVKIPNCN